MGRIFSALRILRAATRNIAYRWYLAMAFPGISVGRRVSFGKGITIVAFDHGTLVIGNDSAFQDYASIHVERGRMTIGRECLIGRCSVIVCQDRIALGDGVLIAEHVTIRDQDHLHGGDGRIAVQGFATAPIAIGDNVWLGAKVTVTKGVEIAPGSIIGANAVVTRSLARRGSYGGVPARRIGP
ncbi:MAG TPA: acyltransferase [Novosphingobium sp.]|nr:acyltransferase [Novosphingobium sp.]